VTRSPLDPSAAVAVAVAAVVLAAAGAPLAAAQSGDRTTITVVVVTERETPVPGATVSATWEGGETTGQTAGNGRVFLDVPVGATVAFDVDHPDVVRNSPYRRTIRADTDEVTVVASPAVTFTYRVRDADGDALSDVAVSVTDDDGREVAAGETDADGRYASPRLAAGAYTVRFERTGYFDVTRSESGSQSVTRPIEMERGLVTLAVNVSDPRVGTPVADATVEAAGESATTGADGRADLAVPVNTEVDLVAAREGYADARTTVPVAEADRSVNVSLARLPNLTLSAANDRVVVGERVVVEVRDAYGGPAANVTVLRDGEAVGTTDAEGELAVPVEAAGDHTLRARRGNVRSATVTVEGVATGDGTTAAPGTSTGAVRTPSSGLAPGFGALAALVALVAAGAYAGRSSRR
jgi:5-hydroxyisourate hydrolase-like protein (transthyretin family)